MALPVSEQPVIRAYEGGLIRARCMMVLIKEKGREEKYQKWRKKGAFSTVYFPHSQSIRRATISLRLFFLAKCKAVWPSWVCEQQTRTNAESTIKQSIGKDDMKGKTGVRGTFTSWERVKGKVACSKGGKQRPQDKLMHITPISPNHSKKMHMHARASSTCWRNKNTRKLQKCNFLHSTALSPPKKHVCTSSIVSLSLNIAYQVHCPLISACFQENLDSCGVTYVRCQNERCATTLNIRREWDLP